MFRLSSPVRSLGFSLFSFFLSSFVVLFFLAGCSGDDVQVELTGQVDRTLSAGMKACLDTSGNGKCDADEPSGRTNADGTYSVIIPAESLGQFPLVVEPTKKEKTADITLSAPAGKHDFVSPISTAVQSRVYLGSTLAEAEADVRARYALPENIDLYTDYQGGSLEPEPVHALLEAVASDYGFDVAGSEDPAEVAADSQRVAVRRVSRVSAASSSDNGIVEEVAGSSSSSAVSAVDSGSGTPGSTVVAVTAERSISAGNSGAREKNALSSSADNSDKDSQSDGSHEEDIDKNDSSSKVSGSDDASNNDDNANGSGTGDPGNNSGHSNGSGTGDPGDNNGNSDPSDNFMSISAIQLDVLKIEACADEGGCTTASGPMQLDLLELADGTVDFANQVLLPDNTKELRLILSENNTITADGISSDLTVPSGQTSGLKLKGQQVIPEEGGFLTSITLDLDLEKALVVQAKKSKSKGKGKGKKGSSDDDVVYSFKLKPVIKVGTAQVEALPENMAGVVALPGEDITLTLGDDFSMQIPAGAVSEETIITAEEVKYFVEVKDEATGEVLEKPGLASTYELHPDGLNFAKPLEVSIQYHTDTLRENIPETSLTVLHDIENLETKIDTDKKVATADIYHFSRVTVTYLDFSQCRIRNKYNTYQETEEIEPGIVHGKCLLSFLTNDGGYSTLFRLVAIDRVALKDKYKLKILAKETPEDEDKPGTFVSSTVENLAKSHEAIVAINGTLFSDDGCGILKKCYKKEVPGLYTTGSIIMDGYLKRRASEGYGEVYMAFGDDNSSAIPIKRFTKNDNFYRLFEEEFGVTYNNSTPQFSPESTYRSLEETDRIESEKVSPLREMVFSRSTLMRTVNNVTFCGLDEEPDDEPLDDAGDEVTAIGYNSDVIMFLVNEQGRSGFQTYQDVCTLLNTYSIQEAIQLDGGGSSQLVIDGELVNADFNSSYSPRHIVNAIGLVSKDQEGPEQPTDGDFIFPFAERDTLWQICQGYNTPNISHYGNLIHSFDFAYGSGNLGNTGCAGNPGGSEDKTVVAPAAGTVLWNGANDTDITCFQLESTVSNGHGEQVASVKLGHMKSNSARASAGQYRAQGEPIGKLCGPTGCPSSGPYAHTHFAAYTTSNCTGVTVPFGTVFGSGYDFSSNGSFYQWHGTEISSGNPGTTSCPDGTGYYCGKSSLSQNTSYLYYCQNGNYSVQEQCSNGCEAMPSGTNDQCKAVQATCPAGTGLYCGTIDTSLNDNTLYYCQNGNYSVQEVCSNGCEVMPSGTNDQCKAVQASCPSGTGLYCGKSSLSQNTSYLYYCQNGNYSVQEQCSNGCETMASGTNDECKEVQASCPYGTGDYCGSSSLGQNTNTLYYCQDGNYSVKEQCSNGCELMPPYVSDKCKPGTCPSGNGLYCGTIDSSLNNNTLYYCQDGNYSVQEQCSYGCKTMPSGYNDQCN